MRIQHTYVIHRVQKDSCPLFTGIFITINLGGTASPIISTFQKTQQNRYVQK